MSKTVHLRPAELRLFRGIMARHTLREGRVFMPHHAGVVDPASGQAFVGLVGLGLLQRRTYKSGSVRYIVTEEGRCLAEKIWPPLGDPNNTLYIED
jgi:hypothetical protein